jgi:hypothetical protein
VKVGHMGPQKEVGVGVRHGPAPGRAACGGGWPQQGGANAGKGGGWGAAQEGGTRARAHTKALEQGARAGAGAAGPLPRRPRRPAPAPSKCGERKRHGGRGAQRRGLAAGACGRAATGPPASRAAAAPRS